jgi:hypothetical protein
MASTAAVRLLTGVNSMSKAGGLLEFFDEAAVFALQLFHALDVGDGEADRFGGCRRGEKAGGQRQAGNPFLRVS